MAKILFFIIGMTFIGQNEPKEIGWKLLEDVSYEETFLKDYNDWFLVPKFGDSIKTYSETSVFIKGYIIPMDLDGKEFALSAYPFSSCFFCGGAGPESVMTLKFSKPTRKFKTDEVVTFSGILKLNNTNPDDFSYILRKAKERK